MPNPLLTTKIHIPPVRSNLVPRLRLIARLNETSSRPLTLISAPPGFGKTTLVTAWLAQHSLPAAWLSLDERDNDLARFLAYLVAALETVQPEVGRQVPIRVHAQRKPSLEALMTPLINDIATIPHDFILVLDDYHLIQLQTIHEAMAFLLDHIPASIHLVIATRADPPLPLTRLRARNQLIELRVPDLRFTPDEATAFLNQHMGLSLTAEQIAALNARAEGWIAGLQLAALSMQGHRAERVAGFVQAFTGSNRFVLDYLAEEVLQRQTPEIQSFLLQTSILDQINAPLGDAVTRRNDSAQILMQLDKANLFVIPLDDARQWYRYHHLFDDLLQSRLRESQAEQIPELHRRASDWYEKNEFINEAVDHALAIPDFERAARLIEPVALPLVMRSEISTLLNWIAQLPENLVRQRHTLLLLHATALAMIGKIELGSARLAQVDDTQLDPQARELAHLLRGAIALLRADTPQAIESARTTLEVSQTSLANPQSEFGVIAAVYFAVILTELQITAGKLQDAIVTCQRGLEFGNTIAPDSPWVLVLGFIHIELAELFYEWNDLAAAQQHAEQGLKICRAGRNEELESYGLVALAQAKQAQGDPESAYNLIQQATQVAHRRNITSEVKYVSSRLVKVLIAQERVGNAMQVVSELPREDEPIGFIERGMTSCTRARVLIAQRLFAQATQELERVQTQVQSPNQAGTLIECLALLALAHQGQSHPEQAQTALTRALALAEPEGYIRTFVDLGERMKSMISDLGFKIDTPNLVRYADKLMAAFPVVQLESANQKSEILNLKSAIPEHLSERELEVLRLIADGLSNQAIAERLVLTVNTIKTHVNNIFGKLSVANRTQAVAKARELKLL